jgi:hypothetical protein
MAPSTLGTFLRAFTYGHIRQLDRRTEQLLGRAWAAGAGPGDAPMTIDLDSTICEVPGYHKQGAGLCRAHVAAARRRRGSRSSMRDERPKQTASKIRNSRQMDRKHRAELDRRKATKS